MTLLYYVKFVIVLLGCSFLTVSAVPKKDNTLKENEVWQCIRWTWSSQELSRQVICLDWRKEDCSKRLHKELCKGNR